MAAFHQTTQYQETIQKQKNVSKEVNQEHQNQYVLFKYISQYNWNLKKMQRISAIIIKSIYRLHEKPITTFLLLLISILVNTITIITILNLKQLNPHLYQANIILKHFQQLRLYIYLQFLHNHSYLLPQGVLVLVMGFLQAGFLYFLLKESISQFCTRLLNSILYIKITFGLPILAILLYALSNPTNRSFIFTKTLATLIIIISSATEYIYDYLNFSCLYKKVNINDGLYDSYTPKSKLIIKFILLYTTFRGEVTNVQLVICLITIIFLHLILLVKLIQTKISRYNKNLQIFQYMSYIFIISFSLVQILTLMIDLIQKNLWFVLCSFFLWSTCTFYNVMEYCKNQLLVRPLEHIEKEQQAISYMRLLYKIYESTHQNGNSIRFLGLIKNHANQCVNPACICQTVSQKQISLMLKNQSFLLNFIQANIEALKQKFEDSTNTWIAALAFYVQIMKKFPKYFYQASKHQISKMALHQRYALYQIQRQACRLLDQRTFSQTYKKSLELFEQETKISECYNRMGMVLGNMGSFYGYNSRTSCSLNLLQKQLHYIYLDIEKIESILNEKQIPHVISIEFILLMMFFFRNILNLSFKVQAMQARLEIIYKCISYKQLRHENFDACMHSESGCVIQSTINNENFGQINSISKNAHKIFTYPSQQSMLGIDINRLLPKCQRKTHQQMINNWIQTGSFKKINKMCETFCSSYEENLINCIIRIHLAVAETELLIFVGIIKKDDQNYMMIDEKRQIDSCGLDFSQILENQPKSVDVREIFPSWESMTVDLSTQQRTIKTQITPMFQNKTNYLQNRRKSLYRDNREKRVIFDVTLQISKGSLGQCQFIIIKKLNSSKHFRKMTRIWNENNHMKSPQIYCKNSQDEIGRSRTKKKLVIGSDNQNQNQHLMAGGSSSSAAKESNYSVQRILEELSMKFKASAQIRYPFLQIVSNFLICLFPIILAAILGQLFLYIKGLSSYNEVIFADAAVSDNMQLLEILYNKIIMYEQHCGLQYNEYKCNLTKISAENIYTYLYALMAVDIRDLVRNETFFKHKYFIYEFVPINLTIGQTTRQVDTYQFMEYYIHSYKQINQYLEINGKVDNATIQIIHILKDNWEEMKRINHFNLQYYESIGFSELQNLNKFVILLSVVCAALFTAHVVAEYSVQRRREELITKILHLFRMIPIKTSNKLSEYFNQLNSLIRKKKPFLLSDVKDPEINGSNPSSLNNQQYINYSSKIKFLTFWSVLILLVAVSAYVMTEYNTLWQKSFESLGNLMDSQNYLLESYIQLKAYYLFPPNPAHHQPQQLNEALLFEILEKNQVQFVDIALETANIIHSNNMNISHEYSEVLIGDICKITQSLVSTVDFQRCVQDLTIKVIQEGILASMAYFQRTVFQAVFDLKGSNPLTATQYFRQLDFDNLDNYLYFMFKMYQLTQSKMIQGLNQLINNRISILGVLTGIELFVLTILILWWIVTKKTKKKQLAQAFGYTLIYPLPLIKESKFIQQTLCKILLY